MSTDNGHDHFDDFAQAIHDKDRHEAVRKDHDKEDDMILGLSAATIALGLLSGYLVRKHIRKGK